MITPTRTDPATVYLDLKLIVATGAPESEWLTDVERLIKRPLSERERANVLHSLRGYAVSPWSTLWLDSVRSTARLLVAGGMA